MDDLMSEFAGEVRDGFAALAPHLPAWRADPRDVALTQALSRFLHSVKGNAGFVRLARVEHLAAAAEQALSDVAHWALDVDAPQIGLIIAALERINAIAEAIEVGIGYPARGEDVLIEELSGRKRQVVFPELPYDPQQLGSVRLARQTLDVVLQETERVNAYLCTLGDAPLPSTLAILRNDMRALLRAVRLLRFAPLAQLFVGVDAYVSRIAALQGVAAAFVWEDEGHWLDRGHLPVLRTAVGHLVRNAVAHGIEPVTERRARGKPDIGIIRARADQDGAYLRITIRDDGRGIDYDWLVTQAAALGHDELAPEVLALAPGVSTATCVSDIAGHGVGLDSVRVALERIDGGLRLFDHGSAGFSAELVVPKAGG